MWAGGGGDRGAATREGRGQKLYRKQEEESPRWRQVTEMGKLNNIATILLQPQANHPLFVWCVY